MRIKAWDAANVSARIWERDGTVWVADAEQAAQTKELTDRLGWLDIGPEMLAEADDLAAGFRNPPHTAGIRAFWWWLNSNVTKEAITRDLEEMKAKGFNGALIFDADGSSQRGNRRVPAGPVFGSAPWTELFVHACQEAKRLDLELSLNIQSGWNLGGPKVTAEEATQTLVWSKTKVKGPATYEQVLPSPRFRDFYRDVAVIALPGVGLPAVSGFRPIKDLHLKNATRELGGSAPDCTSGRKLNSCLALSTPWLTALNTSSTSKLRWVCSWGAKRISM